MRGDEAEQSVNLILTSLVYVHLCFKFRMPAREPTYYRWAEDKPCTTNQTYGFDLRDMHAGNGCVRCNSCKVCAAEAAAAADATAKKEARRQEREMAGNRRDRSAADGCYSGKVQCKPINKGYTMGHVPITKRLKAAAAASGRRQRGVDGTTVSGEQHQQSNGKDLYLWHALSGTLVYCKNDDECVE